MPSNDFAILKMQPCLTQRPWGGEQLAQYGKKVQPGETIGESWELSDHPDGHSTIEGGSFDGMSFGELIRQYPLKMLGSKTAPEQFPLLVKLIDAREDLSVQVHPSDADTHQLGIADRGKYECWYIMDCQPGSRIVYGLKTGVTQKDLEAALAGGQIEEALYYLPLSRGLFLAVPPGTVHAILGGTLLCEIQQSSNTTFRLWDWNRRPPRPLHIKESLAVINFDTTPPAPIQIGSSLPDAPELITLTRNEFFAVSVLQLAPQQSITLFLNGKCRILTTVGGSATLDAIRIHTGETYFIPACRSQIRISCSDEPVKILISESLEIGSGVLHQ